MKENTQAKLEQNQADIDRLLEEQKKLKTELDKIEIKFGDYGMDEEKNKVIFLLDDIKDLCGYWLNTGTGWASVSLDSFRGTFVKQGNIVDDIK